MRLSLVESQFQLSIHCDTPCHSEGSSSKLRVLRQESECRWRFPLRSRRKGTTEVAAVAAASLASLESERKPSQQYSTLPTRTRELVRSLSIANNSQLNASMCHDLIGTGATNFETNSKDASMAPFSQFWSGARASVIALNALCQWLFYVRALLL